MKHNYRATRRSERDNEPSAERHIVGTDWVLQVFEGYDQKTRQTYYHYRFLRTNADGSRTYSTARPAHLVQQVAALMVACRGFSQLSAIDSSIREQLAILADHLAKIPLPQLSDGQPASGQPYVNGVVNAIDNAFGIAG